jgi:hypothetical protein
MTGTDEPNLAQDLVRIHKVITRGLTVGLSEAERFWRQGFPDDRLRQGFTDYVRALVAVLGAHHMGEDEVAFPVLRVCVPAAPYEDLYAAHREIGALLGPVRKATDKVAAGGGEADLTALIDYLQRVSSPWHPHYRLEEEHFSEEALAAAMDKAAQASASAAMAKHSQDHASPAYLVLPFVLYNLEAEDRAAMAATLPSTVVEDLIPKVWKGQWAPMEPFLLR